MSYLFRTVAEMSTWRRGRTGTLAFVPTMGALHAGHRELLIQARKAADNVVLSIFVNPTQFGPGEDFEKYPRALEADLAIAQSAGVDSVFCPTDLELYPAGASTFVEETRLSQGLCGEFRPTHFRGVTTVVLKLFNIIRPDKAFFGLKDIQQFHVVRRMVKDLMVPVELIGVETVREADGLAMSSRNAYLSPAEREIAPRVYATLREAREKLRRETWQGIQANAIDSLRRAGFKVQYFELRDFDGERAIAVAAHLGTTRLIDNVLVK